MLKLLYVAILRVLRGQTSVTVSGLSYTATWWKRGKLLVGVSLWGLDKKIKFQYISSNTELLLIVMLF